jgi:uncharacterized NAD(P)/FAD-binding protein YdhS
MVLILGGGFSGTCAAIHLLRQRDQSLDVVLIEPAARLGGGLAHSSADPDHRLNAPVAVHVVLPDPPGHLEAWLRSEGRIDRDPDALCDGAFYPRRSDFGDYMRAQLNDVAQKSISAFRHLHDRAVEIDRTSGRLRVTLESAGSLDADGCIVATGHERPSPPHFIPPAVAASFRYLNDPWNLDALGAIERRSDILLLGTALTAADVVATLSRRGHAGHLTALSRHGYKPASQNPSSSSLSLWEAINVPVPAFVARHGTPARVGEILRILRANIDECVREGHTWHNAFDEVRNAALQLWGTLPRQEKRRFLRHVRALYDPHRFRLPAPTARILDRAQSSGGLTMLAGRISSISPTSEGFDMEFRPRGEARTIRKRFGTIINCTGPEISPRCSANPLTRSLLERGLAREDEAGIGLATDRCCQALDHEGRSVPGLYLIGPLTRGLFGETPGVPLITWEVLTLLPSLLAHLRMPN